MLIKNISRRIDSVKIILSNLFNSNISNSAKSSYYRSALILLYTIVEGLTYELVKRSTTHNGHVIGIKTKHKEKHIIKSGVFNSSCNFYICEKVKSDILISDTTGDADFGKLIIYLKNNKLISETEYKLIHWVQKERNKIHLQGLTFPDVGYNKLKLKKTNKIIGILVTKISKLPE